MKTKPLLLSLLPLVSIALLICGCSACKSFKSNKEVSFTPLRNYFVLNSVQEGRLCNLASQEDFSALLSPAALMGKDGEPTKVNFDSQSVLAVVLAPTAYPTDIKALSLQEQGPDTLVFTYQVIIEAQEQSYTISPFTAIVVPKSLIDARTVVFKKM